MLLFAVPSGVICAAAALTTYAVSSTMELNAGASEEAALLASQAAATTCLFIVATAVLLQSARPLNAIRLGIVTAMVVAFLGVIVIPWLATFFALTTVGLNAPTGVAVARGRGGRRPRVGGDAGHRQVEAGMTARVGLSTSSVYPETTAAAFELAGALGYDGVEVMVGTDATSQDPDALKALVDHYEVPILSIHAPCLLVTQRVWGTDPWGKLQRAQAAAERLGADTVVVHPPFRWQRDYAGSSSRDWRACARRPTSASPSRTCSRGGPAPDRSAPTCPTGTSATTTTRTRRSTCRTRRSRGATRWRWRSTSATGSRTSTWPTAPTPPATSTSSRDAATSRSPRC